MLTTGIKTILALATAAFLCNTGVVAGQGLTAETTLSPTIKSIKFFKREEQTTLPVIRLGQTEQLELHFDDLQTSPKNYFYTYILCNADWSYTGLSQMDYIKGFTQNRLNQYRASGGTFQRYFHYQAMLPDRNCVPARSGNYILRVFLNGDTGQTVFTRRMLVVDDKATVAAEVKQPFDQRIFLTHQKLITRVDIRALDVFNPAQQLKVVAMQNYRWDQAQQFSNPTFIRGKQYEYSAEDNFVFEGGKEWRWLDLRSFRLQSDRVASVDYKANSFSVFVRPDTVRSPFRYLFYSDLNGRYIISHLENINPFWQGDYAQVHFTFVPNDIGLLRQREVFLFGEMTGYTLGEQAAMQWNDNLQAFEKTLLLKNGFYSYNYVTRPLNQRGAKPEMQYTEGNTWESENQYSIMVYYRAFGGRSDELVGYIETNSLQFLTPQRR